MKRPTRISLLIAAIVGLVLLACRAATSAIPPLNAATPTVQLVASPTSPKNFFPIVPNGTQIPVPTAADLFPPAILHDRQEKMEDTANHYTIQWVYPSLDEAAPQALKFNAAIQTAVDGVVADFKKNATEAAASPVDVPGSFLELKYQQFYNNRGLLSLQLQILFYIAGAAHPNSYTIPFNYDLRADRELSLADLFRPGSGYLETVSASCITELQKHDFPLFLEGAQPKEENYRSWNITPDGLRVTFDPYQVTAYAAGPQVVTLPWKSLADLLDQSLPLPVPGP